MPLPRKLDDATVRQMRADYLARREAERAIAHAKTVLDTTPDAMNWARSLGVSQNAVLNAAKCVTYREVL